MVTNITSLTGNGLRDWLIQRGTAVVLGIYFAFLIVFFACHPKIDYQTWRAFYQ